MTMASKSIEADVQQHRRRGCTRLDCAVLRHNTKPWRLVRDGTAVRPWLLTYTPGSIGEDSVIGPAYAHRFHTYGFALIVMRRKMAEQRRAYAHSVGVNV